MSTRIEVRIPYEPGCLGKSYNDIMRDTKDWALILDHDVYVALNPHWYTMCQEAIEKVGHAAGWITCKTNRIGTTSSQRYRNPDYPYCKDPDDIVYHTTVAHRLYKQYGNTLIDFTKTGQFSGFFILTHKEAWSKAGGFVEIPGKFLGIDTAYYRAVRKAGYKLILMPGLYVYHIYNNKPRTFDK